MAITVAQVESLTVAETAGFLAKCGMSAVKDGTNPDLAAPIANALRALGYGLLSPAAPSDTDLMAVADDKQDLYLGVVHLYTLRACMGRWAKVDQTVSLGGQKLSQMAEQLQKAYDTLAKDLLDRYGFGRRRRRQPKVGRIAAGNTWPNLPPPPSSAAPWPAGYEPAPGPNGNPDVVEWGFNP